MNDVREGHDPLPYVPRGPASIASTGHTPSHEDYERPAGAPSWTSLVPELKPGTYADGLPLDELQYLSCKLVLRPNHFVSRQRLFDSHGVPLSSYVVRVKTMWRQVWLIQNKEQVTRNK